MTKSKYVYTVVLDFLFLAKKLRILQKGLHGMQGVGTLDIFFAYRYKLVKDFAS